MGSTGRARAARRYPRASSRRPFLLALALAFACVLANAFFVAAEFALARVRPTALESAARSGDVLAKRALEITKRLDQYLTACQFGITLASLGLGWLGEPAIAELLRPGLSALQLSDRTVHGIASAIAFTIISVLHVVVGELVPKSLAILKPEQVSRLTARPMRLFYTVMFPALTLLNGMSNMILRMFGFAPVSESGEGKHSSDEIRLIVEATFGSSDKERMKRELLERVLRASDRPVRSLMLPRVDMHTLSLSQTMDEWLIEIRKSGFSRYPVTQEGNADHIRGYVYVKDLLLAQTPPRTGLRGLLRDLLFVPESLPLAEVLTRFRRTNIPIAIVVDEYGGTSGLVTVEDVVEEFVGDLQDELDVPELKVELKEDGTLVVDGSVPLGDVPLDGVQYDGTIASDTVGGYIIEQLGRLAHPGDRVQIAGYEATVEDMRRRRIGRVAFRPHRPTSIPPSGDFSTYAGSTPPHKNHSSNPPPRADEQEPREAPEEESETSP